MTQDEQRIAIAEACGWTEIHTDNETLEGFPVLCGISPKVKVCLGVPDYLNDLNAMHEAEKQGVMLREGFFREYVNWLVKLTQRFNGGVDATAAQRAEAFLRTIGKWKD